MHKTALSRLGIGLSVTVCLMTGQVFSQDETPQRGGTAIVAIGSEPSGVSPGVTTESVVMMVGCVVYQGLVKVATTGEIEPDLAHSWTVSDDGLVYDFMLNEAQWSDGEPFTADDVVYSLPEVNARFHPLFSGQVADILENVEAIAPDHVRVTLSTPFGPFLRMMACANGGAIHPAHIYEGTEVMQNPATTEAPVGTGAFLLTEWRRGDFMRFERNPNYWEEGKPYLDTLIYRLIPDAASRTQALMSGEVDLIGSYYLSVGDLAVLRTHPNVRLEVEGGAPNNLLLFPNLDHPILSDVNVRQALYTAIDRDYIQQTAFSGEGMAATQPFARQIEWTQSDIDFDQMYAFDLERAAQMLDEAGYPAGPDGNRFSVRVIYEAGVAERQIASQAIQDWWGQIGVRLELTPTENVILQPQVFQNKDFDLLMISYSTYGDPALGIARAYTEASIGNNFGNASGYVNPEVEALFREGGENADLEVRTAAYIAVQEILAEELPALVLHSNKGWDAVSANLHGLWGGEDNGRFENAWLSQ